jgi:hypothetical protein
MVEGIRREDDRELARQALRRAAEGSEPAMERLLDAVPEMLAEAERRRRSLERIDPVSAIVPLAWKAIPRLAAAAALLAIVSAALFITDWGRTEDIGQDFDALIFSGNGDTGEDNLLLKAIVEQENGDG